jgi:hypothetical protein
VVNVLSWLSPEWNFSAAANLYVTALGNQSRAVAVAFMAQATELVLSAKLTDES